MCTKYWLTAYEVYACRPDMTLDVYRGRKTTTEQQQLLEENNFLDTRDIYRKDFKKKTGIIKIIAFIVLQTLQSSNAYKRYRILKEWQTK